MDFVKLDNRSILLILLIQHFRVLEMLDELVETLKSSICQCTNLLTLVLLPNVSVEFLVEGRQKLSVHKVDKTVTNIAVILNNASCTFGSQGR